MRVRIIIVAVEKQYYVFWVCFGSLSYSAGNARKPCCHMWTVRLCHIFRHQIIKKKVLNIKHVF
jgi:hypothetical protein